MESLETASEEENEEPITYSCYFCNYKILKNEDTFKFHIKTIHPNKKIPPNELHRLNLRYCDECKVLIRESSLWCRSCAYIATQLKRDQLNYLKKESSKEDNTVSSSVTSSMTNIERIRDPYEFDSNMLQTLYYDFEILNVS